MEDLNMYVPDVHFEKIPIKFLESSQNYQRNLSHLHISKAVRDFDLYQINPIKVSRRNGSNYVFDGQHTIEIIAEKSGSRDTPVWCMIYDDLTYQHEADIFANQQKHVKNLSSIEIFQANVEAQNDTQLIIKDMVEFYGMQIGTKRAPGYISAVHALESIYTKYGYHVLDRVLSLCIATWQGEVGSFSSNILNGIAKVVVTYGNKLKDELFKEKLGELPIKVLSRNAKERCPGCMGFAEVMVMTYNGKKRSPNARLSVQKLHQKEKLYFSGINEDDVSDLHDENMDSLNEENSFFDDFEDEEVEENEPCHNQGLVPYVDEEFLL